MLDTYKVLDKEKKKRKVSLTRAAIARRKIALKNLETKIQNIEMENELCENPIDLTKDKNYQRIKKETATIKSRI